jgi:hypothetical protein
MKTSHPATKWLLVLILTIYPLHLAAGQTIYVDASATGANNGSSWADAYKYLQDALTAAEPDTDIWVAQGTYWPDEDTDHPAGTDNRDATFQLKNNVALYGGFPSGGGSWENRDPYTYETILSGDKGVADNNSDNSYHVVTGSGTDSSAILDGFTVTAGNANGSSPDRICGAGMSNSPGSPTLSNCTFAGNSASAGGGMSNSSSSPTITNCTFSSNSATYGGGMRNISSNPALTNCTFTGNSVSGSSFGGGGMFNNSSSPTLTNCTFAGNSASKGGGMFNNSSSPTLTNCTFSGNLASNDGGGILNSSSSPVVTNCTFTGNSAANGGGMFNIFILSSPKLANCILWGNTATTGAQIYNYSSSTPTVSFSDVQSGWTGLGNIDADPLFVDANGLDNIAGTEDDNLRLLQGSPCIDDGNNNLVPHDIADLDGDANKTEPTPLDLDLRPRFVDGDCNSTVIVDMGAFEFSYAYIGDFDSDCDIDLVDFAILAKAWLTEPPDPQWNRLCDIGTPPDNYIDWLDLDVLAEHWLQGSDF